MRASLCRARTCRRSASLSLCLLLLSFSLLLCVHSHTRERPRLTSCAALLVLRTIKTADTLALSVSRSFSSFISIAPAVSLILCRRNDPCSKPRCFRQCCVIPLRICIVAFSFLSLLPRVSALILKIMSTPYFYVSDVSTRSVYT